MLSPSHAFIAAVYMLATAAIAAAAPFTVSGNTNGSLATAKGTVVVEGNDLTLTIENTSPFDARIMSIGFDLVAGDFDASPPNSPGLDFNGISNGNFIFENGALGNVNQFNDTVIDFGWIVGNSFSGGGSPDDGLDNDGTVLTLFAGGNFLGLSEAEIASGLFVRFQRVGEDGELSDVGRGVPGVSEPASILIFGLGLAGIAAVRRRATRR
jgi:hypothetical protein